MSLTGLAPFDSTVQSTNVWIRELMDELGWDDRHRAYHALRAVLHALRDQLGIDGVLALGAQLPMLVRGVFYEGWHLGGKPWRDRNRDHFLAQVAAAYPNHRAVNPEAIARAVFGLLARHLTPGEIDGVKRALPHDLRGLWP